MSSAPDTSSFADVPLDLDACAREPIHIPGTIQPGGILLVLDPDTGAVIQAAVADAAHRGSPVGDTIDRAFGGALAGLAANLRDLPASGPAYLGTVSLDRAGPPSHHAVAHRADAIVILELEAMLADERPVQNLFSLIRFFLDNLEAASDMQTLCDLAASEVRSITDLDRVMVYRFDEDWNGTVIAESRNDRLPSYLDLRFPASDIPAQARELYRLNRLRLIASADYTPIPIEPPCNPRTRRPIDLSQASLRSVSPVHLQYMRNMGTGASMSISLLRDGKLWGLISCHNRSAKRVPYHVRMACDFLGQVLSLQIGAKEQASRADQRIERRAIQSRLLSLMAGEEDFLNGLVSDPRRMLALTDAGGAAIVQLGRCLLLGETPPEVVVLGLVEWLGSQGHSDLFHTDSLAALWPESQNWKDVASGVLAISISQMHDSYVLWFRPEVVRTVRWGGDPRKPVADGRLSPRTSFEAWKETVRLRSEPWTEADIEAARDLRTAIVDIVLRKAEEMAGLNEQLVRSNKELEAFSYSVSHDLRAPFRHITGYSELLLQSAEDRLTERERRYVATIVESATSAGTLVDGLLSFSQMGRSTIRLLTVDMNQLVVEVRNLLEMEAEGRAIEWRIGDLPRVRADPSMLRLVLQNLFSNAIKFTRGAEEAVIQMDCETNDDEYVFSVRDNGCGFDMAYVGKLFGVFHRLHHVDEFEGTGIGLANVRRIVERHGGRTYAEGAPGQGATFYFTLPVDQESRT